MASGTGNHVARAAIEALEQRIRKDVPHRRRGQFKQGLTSLIDRAPTYFDQLRRQGRRGGNVTLADWIELTLAIGMDPVDALADIMRRPGDDAILPQRPAGEAPAAVQFARKRFRTANKLQRVEQPTAEELARLKELDRLRYDDPETAILRAENAVETVPVILIPQLLGILGSSYRMVLSYVGDAEHSIRTGLDLVGDDDPTTRGDLLQRLAYVIGERGEFHTSLYLARNAMAVHADTGNLARVGQCLVDTGIFRFHLEDYKGAIRAQKSAVGWLDHDDVINRTAVFQGLGLYHQRLGQPQQANQFADQAQELISSLSETSQVRLSWLRASIAKDLKDFDSAENLYRRVLTHFEVRQSPPDLALITLDLVRMLLDNGRRGEARRLAQSMIPLCGKTRNPHIRRVIMELNRHGGVGITPERVSAARQEMRRRQIRPRPG